MSRGHLRIYLGAAPGVGKTYAMLDEGWRRHSRGTDVVVGYVETHGRPKTISQVRDLEIVPRQVLTHRGVTFEEMDLDAVLARRPQVVLVDEMAHTNVPGSRHPKRYEDIEVLLDAGIDVITTMNVQHVESLNDQIWHSTGVRVRETIPDWMLKQADEVVMIDLTPQALLNRLARGVVYQPERAQAALENFFKESTLVALRELAMRQAAYSVESRLPEDVPSAGVASGPAAPVERVLLVLTPDPASAALIRRGRRVADYLRAECLAVYVSKGDDFSDLAPEPRENLERNLNFARGLRIETRVLQGSDTAETIGSFARLHGVTQIFITRQKSSALQSWFASAFVQRVMQVTVVADRSTRQGGA